MFRIVRRLPVGASLAAIAFLFIQVICSLYLPYITVDIVNHGIITGDIPYIWSKGLMMIALSVGSLLGAVLNTLLFSKISYKLGNELREMLYRKVLQFSRYEFDKFSTSSLITRNTNDVTQVQNLVEMGLKFLILSPAYLIGGIIMTYLLSPALSLVFLGAVPFLAVSSFIIYRFASPLYGKMQKLLDQLNLYFREGLTGAKIIRAFSQEDHEYEKYKDTNQAYTNTSITAATIMSVFIPLVTMLISFTTIIITWIGAKSIAAGTIEVGSIIGAISYSAQILMGFTILTSVILAVPRGQVSANRIHEVLDMPNTISDPAHPLDIDATHSTLTYEHVDFRYHGAEKNTLEDISFTIHNGQTLAIIGSTGDGKSSLVNLISRLYDVERGQVFISGINVKQLSQQSLHDQVSFVPQTSTLFVGTIRSNLLIGKPGASDEEIWAALDMACATEFVRELDNGLDSVIAKGGGNFSGGQKQRLCIARALLKDAAIYVFDDSFSALDYKTDAHVRTAMRSKLKDATTVIVAQRISTVMNADLIAVIDKGKLVGLGTHEQLKGSNSVYREIIESQFYKEEAAV